MIAQYKTLILNGFYCMYIFVLIAGDEGDFEMYAATALALLCRAAIACGGVENRPSGEEGRKSYLENKGQAYGHHSCPNM